ncbi:cyclase family protein [Leifsonia sp. fls2-241-R2A-40a]|uniref:cyclase family protein n=1 Tax=Leifsonia sp. fls2-241-R2A-40a TaxID=3040290 RepID=UPI00254B75B2|nr:cyclase family protein [Leifsonia sp. fls2-241-R2A-40a]
MTTGAVPSRGGRIIDLSHPLRSGMPVFPGDPEVRIGTAATIPEVGVHVMSLELGSHSGTHVDAPSHSIDGAATIDTVDLGRLMGPVRVIPVTGLEPRTRIEVDAVSEHLAAVRPGEIVLFRTDWSTRFGEPEYLDHPFLDASVAVALLRAGVTVMGVDTLNPDETPLDDAAPRLPFHDVFLAAGGLIIENLTNLGRITAAAPHFVGLPLAIAGGDGSPLRAVVIEEADAAD